MNENELLDRAVEIINKFYYDAKLLSTFRLGQECGTTGTDLIELQKRLKEKSLAVPITAKNTGQYWFPTSVVALEGKDRLLKEIELKLDEEKKEALRETIAERTKKQQEFLKSRKAELVNPIVLCKNCDKDVEISEGVVWFNGSSLFNSGFNSFLGSVSCPKCQTQLFFGFLQPKYSIEKWSNDKIFKEGIALKCSKEAMLPEAKKCNEYFTKIYKRIGGQGPFVFYKK